MRAALYCRVSSEDQVRGYSLQTQEEQCRAKAQALGATEILSFIEKGVPGDTLDRPALTELRNLLAANVINLVVVYDPDRLARILALQLLLTDEITNANAQLEFVSFEWQNSIEGRLFYQLRGAISEYEREKIKERTVRGKRAKAAQGGFVNAPNTYGYRFDSETDQLLPDEGTAPIVKEIFRWAREGDRIRVIAERLANMQVPPPGGRGVWWPSTVSRILHSETYAGRMHINRWAFHKEGRRRTRVQRARDEWIRVPVEALVDDATWSAVQAILSRNKRAGGGNPSHPFLLRGFLRCAECGGPLVVRTRQRSSRTYGYYLCSNANGLQGYSLDGSVVKLCRHTKSVPSQALDEAVWERIEAFLAEPESALVPGTEGSEEVEALRQQRTILDQQLAKLEGARSRFLWALGEGLVAEERFASEMRRVNDQVGDVRRQIQAVDGQLQRRRLAEEELRSIRTTLAAMSRERAATDFERRRKIVALLVERIVVGHDEAGRVIVDVQGHVPLDGSGESGGGGPDKDPTPPPKPPKGSYQVGPSDGEVTKDPSQDELVPRLPRGSENRGIPFALVR